MKCSKCGNEYEGNFCPQCGKPANAEENRAEGKTARNAMRNANTYIITATRLAKDLCDKEIAMPCDEGKTHRYAKKIGKHRYVVIDKMKLNQVANL